MIKASLVTIAVLGCAFAEVFQFPSALVPRNPESLVPRTWSLEVKFQASAADVNTDFEPPQPWTMKPAGKFSDVNLKNSIRIKVLNNFYAKARSGRYACGRNGSIRKFFLKDIEGPTSVFTYPSKCNDTSDDTMLWEVDASKMLLGFERLESIRYEFSIRPVNYTDQKN